MLKIKSVNYTKKDIAKEINYKIGISKLYASEILDDLLLLLKELIKDKGAQIKNFGTFKILNKSERIGRNPKNKVNYKISARKSLSFIKSKNLNID